MHYYTHNIGEFAAKTRFLTPEEIGIYVILKDEYFANGMRIACDRIANLMPPQCEQSLQRVLHRFFTENEGFYECAEFDSELANYKDRGSINAENAKKRWEKKRLAKNSDAKSCESDATCTNSHAKSCLTNNQEPITNNQLKEKVKKEKLVAQKPEELTQEKWDQWLGYRKNIKKLKEEFSIFALKLMQTEAQKAGISLERAIDITMENEWKGFKAVYYQGLNSKNNRESSGFESHSADTFKRFNPEIPKQADDVDNDLFDAIGDSL